MTKTTLPIFASVLLMGGIIGLLSAAFNIPLDTPKLLAGLALIALGLGALTYARVGQFVSPWTRARGDEVFFIGCYGAQLWPKAANHGLVALSGVLMTVAAEGNAALDVLVMGASATLVLPAGRTCTVESVSTLSRVTHPGSATFRVGRRSCTVGSGPPMRVFVTATLASVNIITM